jgi:O-antigen ligase
MLQKIIAIVVVLTFFALMFLTKKDRNIVFIDFVLIAFPFISIDLLPSIFSFRIFDFLTLIFLLFFYNKNNHHQNTSRFQQIIKYLFFLLVISNILRTFYENEFSLSFVSGSIQLLNLFIFSGIVYDNFTSDINYVKRIQQYFIFMLSFSFLFLLFQFVFGTEFTFSKSPNINISGGIITRYPSYFQDPQKYGQFLAALSFPVLFDRYSSKVSLAGMILFFISLIALLYTGARAPILGFMVASLLLMPSLSTKIRFFFIIFMLGFIFSLFLFDDYIPVLNRATLDDSYSFRNDIWKDALNIFYDNSLSGIGFGNYSTYVEFFNPDQFWIFDNDVTFFDHPESGYLKNLVEFGIIGFVPFVLIIILVLIKGISDYIKFKSFTKLLFTLAFLTWVIGYSTVYSLGDIRITVMVIVLSAFIVSDKKLEYI